MRTYAYSPIKSSVFPWDEDPIDCLKLVTDNPKMSPSVYPMKPLWKSHDCDQKHLMNFINKNTIEMTTTIH